MQDYEHHKMWKITKSQFHIPYDTNLKCDMCVNFGILHKLLIKFLSLTNHHIAYITLYNITIGKRKKTSTSFFNNSMVQ